MEEKKPIFRGAATALVTPFDRCDRVDLDSFGRLVDRQLEAGIDALVVGGTTGEGSTLTDRELQLLISFAAVRAAGRVPVIAGAGANDTARARERCRLAAQAGADALLVVTPYYNKTSQRGLLRHFTALADSSPLPLILYSVPSRTGMQLAPETLAALARHPNIRGLKDAGGDPARSADYAAAVPEDFALYSGNDDQILPLLALGGQGVISVVSNLLPAETALLCRDFFRGDLLNARRLQLQLLPLIRQLFREVNPIPVKAACALCGLCRGELRLPLTEWEEGERAPLRGALARWDLLPRA